MENMQIKLSKYWETNVRETYSDFGESYRKMTESSQGICWWRPFLRSSSKTSQKLRKIEFFNWFFRIFLNASECIRRHPDASERIRTHPKRSGQVRASPKTSKNFRKLQKFAKTLRKSRENLANILAKACFFPLLGASPPNPIMRKMCDCLSS